MVSSKNVFWQALVFTVIVFALGFVLGFFFDSSRTNDFRSDLIRTEINFLDDQIRNRAIGNFNIDCSLGLESTFGFADKIYEDALEFEEFAGVSLLEEDAFLLHQRYDLLRAVLWMESIELKEKCSEDFHTVVYLYQFEPDSIEQDSKQLFFSRLTRDIKDKHPEEIILIPIAVNTELDSVELIVESYNLSEFPAVIVDENRAVTDIITLEELENVVFEFNK